MNKNIVYCIYSYLENNPFAKNFLPMVKDMELWSNHKNADFKLITKIPDVIEDMYSSIENHYTKNRDVFRKQTFSKRIINSNKPNYKDKLHPITHMYKAWMTKFYVLQDFYNSEYEKMLYVDCDIYPNEEKSEFEFNMVKDTWFLISKSCPPQSKSVPKITTEKYLNKNIQERFLAGCIFLTKDYRHNLSKIFNYNYIYDLWLKDSMFIREESILNYTIYKNELKEDILTRWKNLKCPTCGAQRKYNFRFHHIGNNTEKEKFIYNKEWKQ